MDFVTLHPSEDFIPTVHVAGCFCEWKGKFLLLKRHPGKPQGETWGLPAGKMLEGEDPCKAAVREVYEETGIRLDHKELQEVGRHYIRLKEIDYVFYTYFVKLKKAPRVKLEEEAHLESRWVTAEEALRLPLIIGGKEVMHQFISFSS